MSANHHGLRRADPALCRLHGAPGERKTFYARVLDTFSGEPARFCRFRTYLFDVRRRRAIDARLAARVHADHGPFVAPGRSYHVPVPSEADHRPLWLVYAAAHCRRTAPGPFLAAGHQQAGDEKRQQYDAYGYQCQQQNWKEKTRVVEPLNRHHRSSARRFSRPSRVDQVAPTLFFLRRAKYALVSRAKIFYRKIEVMKRENR